MACFYPNGQPGDGLSPCNTTSPVSHCCRLGDVCVSNGYCFSAGLNSLVRRGCTDKTWNSTACPLHCTTESNFNSADVQLTPCDTYTTFCCGTDDAARACCTNNNETVRIPAGSAILPTATISTTVTISATATCSVVSDGSESSLQVSCQHEKNTVVGVGAGLGVATALAILLGMWFYYQKRQALRQATEAEGRYQELLRRREVFE